MKTIKFLLPVFVLIALINPVLSQKYTTASDTTKLNKEYANVSNDIAQLTLKLAIAQNNSPRYHTRATEAASKAEDAKDGNNKIKNQDKKIAMLSDQLQKKRERLQQLEQMRSAIRATPQ